MVSSGEIAAILKNPDAFDNVLIGGEAPEVMSVGAAKWYLVLGKEEGVAFKEDGTQVWSVRPQGVSAAIIQSVDGRTQEVVDLDAACIAAWQCDTWDEFRQTVIARRFPAPWALFVWSLRTRKDPSPWLRFKLPYNTVKEGLSQLCASPTAVRAVIDLSGPKNIAKWIGDVAPEYMQAMGIGKALSRWGRARARAYFWSGVAVIPVGVVVTFLVVVGMGGIGLSMGLLKSSNIEEVLLFLVVALPGLLIMGVGIGLIIYSRRMRKWSQTHLEAGRGAHN